LECRGGEGALAGEEGVAILSSEEVVEFGLGEAEVRLAFGDEGTFPDLEADGLLGLEVTMRSF